MYLFLKKLTNLTDELFEDFLFNKIISQLFPKGNQDAPEVNNKKYIFIRMLNTIHELNSNQRDSDHDYDSYVMTTKNIYFFVLSFIIGSSQYPRRHVSPTSNVRLSKCPALYSGTVAGLTHWARGTRSRGANAARRDAACPNLTDAKIKFAS